MRKWSEKNELNMSEFGLRIELETLKHKAEATRTGPSVLRFISRGLYYRGGDKFLARSDCKKQLKGRHFSSEAGVTAVAETWLGGQHSELFLSGLQNLSLVAGACFLPGPPKGLSAPPYDPNL
jgi:hypothetical protein